MPYFSPAKETILLNSLSDFLKIILNNAEKLWKEKTTPKWKNIQSVALRKLEQLNKAKNLFELTIPPRNRLEALRGKWKGYYSIRINKQYRIVFIWEKGNTYEVEITDYH